MKVRSALFASLVILATVGALAFISGRPLPAADPPRPTPEVGRYQLSTPTAVSLYLVDTTTGQVWTKHVGSQDWEPLVNPVKAK